MAPYFEIVGGGKPSVLVDKDFSITFKYDTQSSVGVKIDGPKRVKFSLSGYAAVSEIGKNKKTDISSPDTSVTKVGSVVICENDFTVESLISGEKRTFAYSKEPLKTSNTP